MKALTFDQSTSATGWAAGNESSDPRQDNNKPAFGVIKTPKRDEFGERLAIIWRRMSELIEEHRPDVIGYEEPFFPIQGRGSPIQKQTFKPATGFLGAEIEAHVDAPDGNRFNPETLKQLQMVKGLILTQGALRGIPTLGCTPSQWRATFLGYGRKPKEAEEDFMKKAVLAKLRQLGYEVTSHDAGDALGILYHTLHGPDAAARRQGDLLSMAGSGL